MLKMCCKRYIDNSIDMDGLLHAIKGKTCYHGASTITKVLPRRTEKFVWRQFVHAMSSR